MKGVSLFSGAGIAETYLKEIDINIVVANELIEKRAKFYKHLYPDCEMIEGDITDSGIFDKILKKCIENKIEFLIATPPCQGFSLIGKNKTEKDVVNDRKNYLIFKVLELIDKTDFNYILIENVPRFIKTYFHHDNSFKTLIEILNIKYSDNYIIESNVLNAKDYGVPQSRPRAIIKMYKKGLKWGWPDKEPEISLKDVLWDLPSLESGEKSKIKWHYSRKHNVNHILWMKHTKTGDTAFNNIIHYPLKSNGKRIKGYPATYSRMSWNKPAPTVTIRNDAISSQSNVHPGRKLADGTYSDARVLTIYELLIVSSLPKNWNIPEWATEVLIRQVIGEAVPPLMVKKILSSIERGI